VIIESKVYWFLMVDKKPTKENANREGDVLVGWEDGHTTWEPVVSVINIKLPGAKYWAQFPKGPT
jgi:hypothetical protein